MTSRNKRAKPLLLFQVMKQHWQLWPSRALALSSFYNVHSAKMYISQQPPPRRGVFHTWSIATMSSFPSPALVHLCASHLRVLSQASFLPLDFSRERTVLIHYFSPSATTAYYLLFRFISQTLLQ